MLAIGSRIGPHEVVAPLGAGGMGEVYRAHDSRLGRDVAVKVLPAAFSADPDRLQRFEQEARAAGALSHPNLLTVFDIGLHDGGPYIVFELLRGATLRQLLDKGPPPLRKALDYGVQIAQGLAAAHQKGIVHRDLKPDNLFVTEDGRVKILDFGLAKLRRELNDRAGSAEATVSEITDAGAVVGTVGYMSPEQVQGLAADHRSDVFALGCVLYELISGRRAFKGTSAVETLHAILKDDPPEISGATPLPPALERITRRCLEKNADERFQSAHDLAFALEALSGSGATLAVHASGGTAWPRARATILAAGLLGLAVGSGLVASRHSAPAQPSFQQVTFQQGLVHKALFGPDGNIFYTANWAGAPDDVYFARPGNPEGRALGLKDVQVLSVSASGELAVLLHGHEGPQTLARLAFPGGTPRELATGVTDAAWSPDGRDLATIREGQRLEFPVGRVLFESSSTISELRFSPRGDRLALFERSVESGTERRGTIWTVDLAGKRTRVFSGARLEDDGLAFSRDGSELWFVCRPHEGDGSVLRAANSAGRIRDVRAFDGWVALEDVAPSGDVLVNRSSWHQGIWLAARDGTRQDLTWLNRSTVADLSDDGGTMLFTVWVKEAPSVYVRRQGANAVRLGEGEAKALSPDEKWALGISKESFVLYPLGPGQAKSLPLSGIEPPFDIHWALFFPDGRRLLASVFLRGRSRLYAIELDTGRHQPLTPENRFLGTSMTHPFAPDGRRLLAAGEDRYGLYSLDDGILVDVGLARDDLPIRWGRDGHSVFYRAQADQRRVYRLDLRTLRKEPWRDLPVPDATGEVRWVVTTGDGQTFAYTYNRQLDDLYLVKGLR